MVSNINSSPSFRGITLMRHYSGKKTEQLLQSILTEDSPVWKVAKSLVPKPGLSLPIHESESTILIKVISTITGKDVIISEKSQKWISNIDGKHIVYSTMAPNKKITSEDFVSTLKLDLDA